MRGHPQVAEAVGQERDRFGILLGVLERADGGIDVLPADVDPGDLEGALLGRRGATRQTLVAFALLF